MAKKESKEKKIWDNHRAIGEVKKTANLKIKVDVGIREGIRYINIREFYKLKTTPEWRPSRNGLVVQVKQPIKEGTEVLVPALNLLGLLEDAIEIANALPLSDPEHAVYITK